MKLRNKKTGEIGYLYTNKNENYNVLDANDNVLAVYATLKAVAKEWEDYEEPEGWWFIDRAYEPHATNSTLRNLEADRQIGNYFSSREEAEKAVEKLKVLKRLKDNGMVKYSFHKEKTGIDLDFYTLTILAPRDKDSLDLLFGGEE